MHTRYRLEVMNASVDTLLLKKSCVYVSIDIVVEVEQRYWWVSLHKD